jgi:two-component system, NarL family, nitrate/nitrite response regulator NarL
MVSDQDSSSSLKVLAASAVALRRMQWLQALERIATVHEVGDRQTLEHKMVALKPTILLLDLALPELRGRGGFAEIQTLSPSTKIILLTKSPTDNEGTAMLEAGARGYCSADMDAVLLTKAVKMVQKGEVWVGRKVISHLLDILVALTEQQRNRVLPNADPSFDVLTPREKEIVQQIGGGSSNKEIANQLNVSEKTVKAHLTSIFRKLGVSDRLHLALYVNGHRPSFRA